MKNATLLAFGFLVWQAAAPAQTNNGLNPSTQTSSPSDTGTGVIGGSGTMTAPDYAPLTASERWKLYFTSTYGPGAMARAVAAGGIDQAMGSPKEWRGGAEAFGERIGNSFAEHVVRKTLESGAAALLHEDNRYFRSTEPGVWTRSRHAIVSVFLARNEAGREEFSYSRVGGTLGASFISRIWQPHSLNTSGDAAVNFGITMAVHIGWNAFQEFRPRHSQR